MHLRATQDKVITLNHGEDKHMHRYELSWKPRGIRVEKVSSKGH